MYRILCLHGRGSSSQIFQAQLAGLRQRLQDDFELIFVDGEIESGRGHDIPKEFPGPFWCYFVDFTPDGLRAGHEFLEAVIDEEGPFDGVFAFSEGASLIMAFLLELERKQEIQPAPFNFALLFSSAVALSPDVTFALEEINGMGSEDFNLLARLSAATGGAIQTIMSEQGLAEPDNSQYQENLSIRRQVLLTSNGCILRIAARNGLQDMSEWEHRLANRERACIPRNFHPALLRERIRMPTVYVTGLNDDEDSNIQYRILSHLFHAGRILKLEHENGHEIPRSNRDIQNVVDGLSWAIEESKLPMR